MVNADTQVVVIARDVAFAEAVSRSLSAVGLQVRALSFNDSWDQLHPQCVVTELDAPRMTGIEIVQHARKKLNYTPVILLADDCDMPTVVDAMKRGAADVVAPSIDGKALAKRVRTAIDAAAGWRDRHAQAIDAAARIQKLTPRERQVMDLIVDGRLNRQTAEHLGITEKTVEVHRSRVTAKLQANSVADLVRIVLTWRIYNDSR